MEKTYKLVKGFYNEKREIEIEIPEDIKWVKVNSSGMRYDGQHDYFAILPYSDDTDAWFNNRFINKYKLGNTLIIALHAIDDNELPQQSLDEFNSLVKEYFDGYYGICVDKYYRIQWLFQVIRFNNYGNPICNVVVCNNMAGTHTHQLLINEEMPIKNIEEHRYGGIFNIYINNSEHYKKIWYSMVFQYLEEMGLFSDDFLIAYNSQFVDKNLDINEIYKIAQELKDIEATEEDGKIVLNWPEENDEKIKRIKEFLEID